MLFHSKSLTSALVAMVSLSIAVSASLDPIEQHLAARDSTTFKQSREPTGKLATPVNLAHTPVAPQAIFKLTGQDLHSELPDKLNLEQSALVVPAQKPPAVQGADANKAHCWLKHDTNTIKRIRYTMTVQIDRDESGATTAAEKDSVHGLVLKTTSGLYSTPNPDEGSCAKSLARHGEVCANRPYIVPQSILPVTTGSNGAAAGAGSGSGAGAGQPKPDEKEPKYKGGPLVTKRSPEGLIPDDDNDEEHLIFKRDTTAGTKADHPKYNVDTTVEGADLSITGPAGTVCIDTIKRDQEVTKVVPTNPKPKDAVHSGDEPLHFELVRSDDKQNVWSQIIYDSHHRKIDTTHLSLSSEMKVWRAEYLCETCKEGHKKHTVTYENVEIEVDDSHTSVTPVVQCEGEAQSTNAHQRDTSRYANKNGSGVQYTGKIYAIDRVTLGVIDSKGHAAAATVTEGGVTTVAGEVPGQQPVKDNKPDETTPKKRDVDSDYWRPAKAPIF